MCDTMTIKPKRAPKVDPSTIKTYWNGGVGTRRDDKSIRSLVCTGETTLPELLSTLFKHGLYYISIGYADVWATDIEQCCERCYGQGRISRGPRKSPARCPECKGIGKFATLGDFAMPIMPDNGIRVTNEHM